MKNQNWTILYLLATLLPLATILIVAASETIGVTGRWIWATSSYEPIYFSYAFTAYIPAYIVYFGALTYALWNRVIQIQD